ncbi:MAG: undecaprenyldiphospho-muramoylpentapeptide beta-N-acetylglucosaminyltransferase [Candidatus Firestonebacteria bacterium]
MKKVIISCGGTGGHIYPGIAIGHMLKKETKDIEILYVGTKDGMEESIILREKFNFVGVESGKLLRKISLKNLLNFFKLLKGTFQSMKVIKTFKPDLIIGLGGYVCVPVVVSGWFLHYPIILHEQNAVAGLANKILSRLAKKIFIGDSTAVRFFPKAKVIWTGNPVRESIGTLNRKECVDKLGLEHSKRTVTLIGGSQGAHNLNIVFLNFVKLLKNESIQIVWMTGLKDYEHCKNMVKDLNIKILIMPFFKNIEEVYAVTDLIICRAGACTIAEIIKCNLPAIVIPYPAASSNHQFYNAEILVKNNCAILLNEKEISSENLKVLVIKLIKNEDILENFKENFKKISKVDTRKEILDAIREII